MTGVTLSRDFLGDEQKLTLPSLVKLAKFNAEKSKRQNKLARLSISQYLDSYLESSRLYV